MNLHDLLQRPLIHLCTVTEINIRKIFSLYRAIGWNDHHTLSVYIPKLIRRIRDRTAHAGDLLKDQEQVLVGDTRHGAVFLCRFDAFLHLDGLMLTAAELHARHHTTGHQIQKDQFPFSGYHIIPLFFKQHMGPERQDHMTIDLKMLFAVKVSDLEKLFCTTHTRVREPDLFLFRLIIHVRFQRRHKEISHMIQVRLHMGHTRDHERCLRHIQHDGVRLIDDDIVQLTHKAFLCRFHQIIKQVVKSQCRMCRVYNIRAVDLLLFLICKTLLRILTDSGSDGQTHKTVDLSHLLRISEHEVLV